MPEWILLVVGIVGAGLACAACAAILLGTPRKDSDRAL